jgi:hypothetical protein
MASAKEIKAGIKSGKIKVLEAGVGSSGKAIAQAVGKVAEKAVESFSKAGKDLTKAENRAVAQQNKAASTYKTTDLAASDRGKAAAKTRKLRQEEREDYAHSVGEKKGKLKGAAAAAPVAAAAGAVAQYVVSKGTQKDHYVTGRKDSTKKAK